MSYRETLNQAIQQKNSRLCVGLDPNLTKLPNQPEDATREAWAKAVFEFNKLIIDATHDVAACIKPQLAYYEALGAPGYAAYEDTLAYAHEHDLLVIADAKRGDIGSTSAAYAQGHLVPQIHANDTTPLPHIAADALTINPYLGTDGVDPFVKAAKDHNKGLYVLVKTSNPSSSELQDKETEGRPIYEHVADLIKGWQREHDCDSVGAVVGATHPEQLAHLRNILGDTPLLIPGYGAQGGTAQDIAGAFNNGLDAVINSSRGVIFAFEKHENGAANAADHIRAAAVAARDDINSAI